jgi:hypothetical protein
MAMAAMDMVIMDLDMDMDMVARAIMLKKRRKAFYQVLKIFSVNKN